METPLEQELRGSLGWDNFWYPSISFNSIEMNKVDMRYENASSF